MIIKLLIGWVLFGLLSACSEQPPDRDAFTLEVKGLPDGGSYTLYTVICNKPIKTPTPENIRRGKCQ